jgi:hypothetical protein
MPAAMIRTRLGTSQCLVLRNIHSFNFDIALPPETPARERQVAPLNSVVMWE